MSRIAPPGTPKRIRAAQERLHRYVTMRLAERATEARTVRCTDCNTTFVVLLTDTVALCDCGHEWGLA